MLQDISSVVVSKYVLASNKKLYFLPMVLNGKFYLFMEFPIIMQAYKNVLDVSKCDVLL